MSEAQEKLPVHESIEVLEYTTIYRNAKWWCAVVLAKQTFSGKTYTKVLIYLWNMTQGKWKRKGKFTVNFSKNWINMKPVIDKYVQQAGI